MSICRQKNQRGSVIVEMGIILIPLLFIILGVAEIGRAMWAYHTMALVVKIGTRFAIAHGARCALASPACVATVGNVSQQMQQSAIGLDPSQLQLTFVSSDQTDSCGSLAVCQSDATVWPPSPDNAVGLPVTITGRYKFNSVLSAFWPGQATNGFTLAAQSTEVIQF
jgi:Flp pilus assembly protein TadG